MSKRRFTGEQIISKLREAEVLLSAGIKEQTYYIWRKKNTEV